MYIKGEVSCQSQEMYIIHIIMEIVVYLLIHKYVKG